MKMFWEGWNQRGFPPREYEIPLANKPNDHSKNVLGLLKVASAPSYQLSQNEWGYQVIRTTETVREKHTLDHRATGTASPSKVYSNDHYT
jgi:hypothetical protein